MFDNSSIMIIKTGEPLEIFRLEVDSDTQNSICDAFSNAVSEMTLEKSKVVFDGSYKPLDDEYLDIENFQLPDAIKDAIRNPIGVAKYKKENGCFPEIKAIFVGERIESKDTENFVVAFQRFKKEQYISVRAFNLFFDNDTFRREKNYGISISNNIDCLFSKNELEFTSFYYARQIFDLSDYYRSATDQEVQSFTSSEHLSIENADDFKEMANTWIRRKIAMINDSEVLSNYSATKIKGLAKSVGIDISINNKKIVIPNDKEKVKIILGFLDEEAYKGPFSQNTYLANSKRQVK